MCGQARRSRFPKFGGVGLDEAGDNPEVAEKIGVFRLAGCA